MKKVNLAQEITFNLKSIIRYDVHPPITVFYRVGNNRVMLEVYRDQHTESNATKSMVVSNVD